MPSHPKPTHPMPPEPMHAQPSSPPPSRAPVAGGRLAHRTLVAVTLFSAASAVGGGLGMIVTDGLGMPRSLLADGPFPTYFWPGVILLVVVGGTQTLALVLLLRKREQTQLLATAVAGFAMVIWITVEIGLINEFSWPQAIYLGAALLQLAAVYAELGILPISPSASGGTSRGFPRGRR
jgi:hypothetical protein